MSIAEPLFFKVIARSAIWGGTKVHDYFGYDVPDTTGQVWAFAAQEDGDTSCIFGAYEGKSLSVLWREHPELFKSAYQTFPFIISLVAPENDLSVQVHPTEDVARVLGYSLGKNEAWLMLNCVSEASLVYGLNHAVPESLSRVRDGRFEGLFRKVASHTGDFFYIPAGTVHALGRGNITYEVQQATNLTFRIYDYERRDPEGNTRPLNIGLACRSIEAANRRVNETLESMRPARRERRIEDALVIQHISNESFAITSITVSGSSTIPAKGYWLCTVISGKGSINGKPVRFADNVLIPAAGEEVRLEGTFELAITTEKSLLDGLH